MTERGGGWCAAAGFACSIPLAKARALGTVTINLSQDARARLRNTPPSNMSRHWLLIMARLQIIFLVVLPLCSGQFSIQGPSDGNRRAQGLKYSRDKGIEYEDQRASLGAGDFSIQGASDGNNDFQIQGASDGNANFQIHGASDGNANFQIQGATDSNANFQIQGASDGNANFQIQGATDGHSQSAIQGPYDANQGGERALQYRDPSGLSVNWKSYRQQAAQHPLQNAQPVHNLFISQDSVQEQAPIPRRHQPAQRQRVQQQQPQQQQQPINDEAPIPRPNYRPYDNAPPQIKQLLEFQQQIPYLNIIPEQFRYESIEGQQAQVPAAQPEYERKPQKSQSRLLQQEPNQYRSQYRAKSRGSPRSKRQTDHGRQQQRGYQPPVESQPQYSPNVPSRIQDILKFQAQIPYVNHIPEKWRYDALAAAQANEGRHRQKRQAPQYQQPQSQIRQYRQQHQQQQPARQQPQYQRISQPPAESQPHYSTNVPSRIQELLKFQAQIPYVNSIPEKFRYENLAAAQVQHGGQVQPAAVNQYRPQYQQGGHRQKRQAPQYNQGGYQQQPQQSQQQRQPQYQRISQPPAEQQPQYSTNLPGSIQKLLQFQSQTPYNIIANQIIYRPDKPYVPQPVQAPQRAPVAPQYQQNQLQEPQYQQSQLQQPQYQQSQLQKPQYQQPAYQGQGQAAYGQAPGAYGQTQRGVRPVTENQY